MKAFCDPQAHRLALPPLGENCSRGTGTASSSPRADEWIWGFRIAN
jgi:hypothetical protein